MGVRLATLLAAAAFYLSACTSAGAHSGSVYLRNYDELPRYVGKRVTIEGEVTNTKMPTIMGVDVAMPTKRIAGSTGGEIIELRGKQATATGILKQDVVKEWPSEFIQSRGPGTFYELVDEKTGYLVEAQPLSK